MLDLSGKFRENTGELSISAELAHKTEHSLYIDANLPVNWGTLKPIKTPI